MLTIPKTLELSGVASLFAFVGIGGTGIKITVPSLHPRIEC